MSIGKMNTFIDIILPTVSIDTSGFQTQSDTILASVEAYKEDRFGSERWANLAAFSQATALFRFRCIPGVTVTTKHVIVCHDGRYRITSVEDVRGRRMYLEVLADCVQASER